MPSYLQKRRRRWYAIMEIPRALQPRFGGKRRFVQSLGTESRTIAECEVHAVIAAWKEQLREEEWPTVDYIGRRRPDGTRGTVTREITHPIVLYQRLRNADNETKRKAVMLEIEEAAEHIGSINADVGRAPSTAPEAQLYYKRATGQIIEFTAYLDEWLETFQAVPKTKDMHRSSIQRFASDFRMVQDVTRPEVRRWISKRMIADGLTAKTIARVLSGLRSYWRYLQSIDVVDEDNEPFSKLDVSRQAKKPSPGSKRQPFEPKDVVRLLEAAEAKGDQSLADLIRLGMWTGCRIEELCALKVEAVKDGYFKVEDAKTDAGWRDVPIHSKLEATMARLLAESEDGYVLSGLSTNKYGDRSNGVGKRFGNLKSSLGFGRQHVFHSIRKTVVTILENAGVPENVVADIVGHEKTTMTYGLYSGGVSLQLKRSANEGLSYKPNSD